MKGTIKNLKTEIGEGLFVTIETKVSPGDWTFNIDNELIQVNQSLCVYFNHKVLGTVNHGWALKDGDEVTVLFDCTLKTDCKFPFCNGVCQGSESFYLPDYENRRY